jgi:pantothenate kinase-related protein Tda10
MESNRSSAICFERNDALLRSSAAKLRSYGDEFTRHARVVIESALQNLSRFDDLMTDAQMQARVQGEMSNAQIDEAERVFQSDLQDLQHSGLDLDVTFGRACAPACIVDSNRAGHGAQAAGPGHAWINTLV